MLVFAIAMPAGPAGRRMPEHPSCPRSGRSGDCRAAGTAIITGLEQRVLLKGSRHLPRIGGSSAETSFRIGCAGAKPSPPECGVFPPCFTLIVGGDDDFQWFPSQRHQCPKGSIQGEARHAVRPAAPVALFGETSRALSSGTAEQSASRSPESHELPEPVMGHVHVGHAVMVGFRYTAGPASACH